jgi:hypothetical protein
MFSSFRPRRLPGSLPDHSPSVRISRSSIGAALLLCAGCPPTDPVGPGLHDSGIEDTADVEIEQGAYERCDEVEGDLGIPGEGDCGTVWYADADGDGYGDASTSVISLDRPSGYVADGTDCDDTDASITDGAVLATDEDGDGFGQPGSTQHQCKGVANEWDCDDNDPGEPMVVDATATSGGEDGSRFNPWTSIQDGIDGASSCVVVYPGHYIEHVDFLGKNVSVFSTGGSVDTIIDGSGEDGPTVTFANGESSSASLQGFTLTGGSGFEESYSWPVDCDDGITCTVHYTAWCGGGLYVDGATPSLSNLRLVDNVVTAPSNYFDGDDIYQFFAYGGGAFFRDTTISLSDVHAYGNVAGDGGGAYVEQWAEVHWEHSYFVGNTASYGGGVENDAGRFEATNVVFARNFATEHGGGVQSMAGTTILTNVLSVLNDSPLSGGLFLGPGATATVTNSAFWRADTGSCIWAEGGGSFTGSYNNVFGCTGGGYYGIDDPTGTNGNISVEPIFTAVADDEHWANDDWHLDPDHSPMVDAGDPSPAFDDADGTRNDIGAYGGPGSDWQ